MLNNGYVLGKERIISHKVTGIFADLNRKFCLCWCLYLNVQVQPGAMFFLLAKQPHMAHLQPQQELVKPR